ncbi:MAG: hypothetical protein ACU0CO_06725 [Shimia sp.]
MIRLTLACAALVTLGACTGGFGPGVGLVSEQGLPEGGAVLGAVGTDGDGPVLPGLIADATAPDVATDAATASDTAARPQGWLARFTGVGGAGGPGPARGATEATPAAARTGAPFGRRGADAAAREVAPGTVLAFGRIATVCGLSTRDMGTQVEAEGRYTLFDSAPSAGAPRTHYLTGFRDGCARQFTAAMAMFGGADVREHAAITGSHRHVAPTATDREYAAIRARVCRVGAATRCPEARLRRLARGTAFVSVYDGFGTNPSWADVLLHDGAVVAKDFRGS